MKIKENQEQSDFNTKSLTSIPFGGPIVFSIFVHHVDQVNLFGLRKAICGANALVCLDHADGSMSMLTCQISITNRDRTERFCVKNSFFFRRLSN